MTTLVTVNAHAGWPVKVEAIEVESRAPSLLGEVPAGQVMEFHATSERQLLVTELGKG